MRAQDNIYDSSDTRELLNPTFTEASTRANINSQESHSIILGKIKKWFADLQAHFFNMVGQPADVTDPSNPIPGIATLDQNGNLTISQFINAIYPIGAVYLSTNNTNPGTFFTGTTWVLLPDGYLRNNASAASGGSLTSGSTILTTEQIPSHSHTATTQSTGAHTHTATTQSTGAHTHTATTGSYGAHSHTATTGSYGNHTHTATTESKGSHSHTSTTQSTGAHRHTIEDITGSSTGAHRAMISWPASDYSGGWGYDPATWHDNRNCEMVAKESFKISSNGDHSHTLTTNSDGNHSHTLTTQNTGAHTHTLTTQSTGAHTHTLTTGSYGAHSHTLTTESTGAHSHTLTTEAIGGGKGHTHDIEPTYARVYAFERTA